MTQLKSFSFITNSLEYHEIGTKSGTQAIIRGYISTDEVDRANEIVTKNAMKEMLSQIKSGNIKLDVEHSTFIGKKDIPVGKITDAGIDDKGLWISATLNKSHEKFKSVWNSIKDGFLDAFSIAYTVKEQAKEIINGVTVTLLKSLELLNVAITGDAMNRGAKMTESFMKSMIYLKDEEENKMSDEVKVEEPVVEVPTEEVKEEPKVEEPVVEESKEEKVEPAKEEPKEEVEVKEEPVTQPLDSIKSLQKENAELKTDFKKLAAELKSLKEDLAKPQLKAAGATDIAEVKGPEIKTPFEVIQ